MTHARMDHFHNFRHLEILQKMPATVKRLNLPCALLNNRYRAKPTCMHQSPKVVMASTETAADAVALNCAIVNEFSLLNYIGKVFLQKCWRQ